jgi:hypothetical protein
MGTQPISVNYTDANGCSASANSSISVLPNNAPNIVGLSPVYCVGSPSDTIFGLPANGTWTHTFVPTQPNPNPTFSLVIPNPNGVSPYAVLQPRATGTVNLFYTINNPNGCFNVQTNTFAIQPSLRIGINAPATVCANNGAVRLSAVNTVNSQDITRAINFVYLRNSQPLTAAIFNDSMLNPNIGYILNSNDTIVATYADAQSGCVDTARVAIAILAAPTPVITFPNAAGPNNNIYCVDTTTGTTTTILGSNNVGGIVTGIFSSRRNRISASSNTTADFRTDSILVDTISYIVTNNSGCRDSVSRTIEIRGLPIGLVLAGVQPRYCQGSDPLNISGFPTPSPSDGIIGEVLITNLSNNQVTNFGTNIVNLPSIVALGNVGRYRVSYNYSNEFGCASSISSNFDIHPSPMANFEQIGFCAGDVLQFNDISTFGSIYNNLDSITSWRWLFNNQTAPDTNTVFFSPQIPNSYLAQLIVVSAAGCAAEKLNIISIYKYPNVGFKIDGGCQHSPIGFSLDSTGLNPITDSLTTAVWNFGNGNSDSQNTIINNFCQVRSSSHNYTSEGVYYPTLTTDQATLGFDSPLTTDFDYQLFDMRGVELQKGRVPSGVSQVQLNLYDLPAGVYVVHLQAKNGAVRVQRRIVVHKP